MKAFEKDAAETLADDMEEAEARKELCSICHKPIEGWGNNAWPVVNDGRCCDHCNWSVVLPARLGMK